MQFISNTSLTKVTVVLPVYNGQAFLQEAVDSVFAQETTEDFELLVLDDGSTDASAEIIANYHDPRLTLIQHPNMGLAATLNKGLALSHGQYILRQDQDDLLFPGRLAKQTAFLDGNPEIAMVGTWAEIWVGDEKSDRTLQHPADDASIKFSLLFNNPFVHSSVMIRRRVLEEVGGYCEDKSRQPPEDYELWSRIARKHKLANIPEVLMVYREVPGSMSRTGINPFLTRLVKISAENIAWFSGRPEDAPEVIAISKLCHGVYEGVPRGVSFSQMESVLKDAATNIANGAGVSARVLDDLLESRLNMLRYHYFEQRTGGWLGKLLRGRFGGMVKRVARKLLTVVR